MKFAVPQHVADIHLSNGPVAVTFPEGGKGEPFLEVADDRLTEGDHRHLAAAGFTPFADERPAATKPSETGKGDADRGPKA